jgi:hypothetical protein
MKRTLVSALLPLGMWAGCDSNVPPNTAGNCKGLITVNLTVPSGVNSAAAISSTALGPERVRYEQVDVPPLAVPNVVLRLKDLYKAGNQIIRVAAADADPSKGSTAVTSVARISVNTATTCPSVTLALTATKVLDICNDRCDSEVRCGQRPFSGLEACLEDCRQHEAEFAQQQADWIAQYENGKDLVNELEGCNFLACGAIDSCGEAVMRSAVPKM